MEAHNSILGISLGTRQIGIALCTGGQLYEWQVKTFTGKWSKSKLRGILLTLSGIIDEERVGQVAVKIPDIIPASKGFTQLMGGLNVLCEQKHFKARYYTLSDIKKQFAPDKELNKETLAEIIVACHPELQHAYRKQKKRKNAYYYKLFEAVAAAHLLYVTTTS